MIQQIRAFNKKTADEPRNFFERSRAAAASKRKELRAMGLKIIETIEHGVPRTKSEMVDLLNNVA